MQPFSPLPLNTPGLSLLQAVQDAACSFDHLYKTTSKSPAQFKITATYNRPSNRPANFSQWRTFSPDIVPISFYDSTLPDLISAHEHLSYIAAQEHLAHAMRNALTYLQQCVPSVTNIPDFSLIMTFFSSKENADIFWSFTTDTKNVTFKEPENVARWFRLLEKLLKNIQPASDLYALSNSQTALFANSPAEAIYLHDALSFLFATNDVSQKTTASLVSSAV